MIICAIILMIFVALQVHRARKKQKQIEEIYEKTGRWLED